MATITEQLIELQNIKTNIAQAIVAKGVDVAADDKFSTYPAKITAIKTGSTVVTEYDAATEHLKVTIS